MQWGPQLDFLMQMWQATGRQPTALRGKPELSADDAEMYSVFRQLSSARSYTEVGPQPIPVSEVLAYCEMMRLRDLDLRQAVLQIVQTLDGKFVEHQVKKMQGKRTAPDSDGHPKSA